MKAPVCFVCGKWRSEAGGSWFQFKVVDSEEIEFNRQFFGSNPPVSHPFGNHFFCDEHSGFGWKFRHKTWNEARPLIQKAFEENEIPKPPVFIRILRYILKSLARLFGKN